jgi:hypothetical protein
MDSQDFISAIEQRREQARQAVAHTDPSSMGVHAYLSDQGKLISVATKTCRGCGDPIFRPVGSADPEPQFCSSACATRYAARIVRYHRRHPKGKLNTTQRFPSRWSRTQSVYGLGRDDYYAILGEQEGRCAVCCGPSGRESGYFDVDHDHATGKVRGLLCNSCNKVIVATHSPDWYLLAHEYLMRPGKSTKRRGRPITSRTEVAKATETL